MSQYISAYQRVSYSWSVLGQPIPAPRLTQVSAHHPVIPRGYYAFKGAVVAALLDAYPGEPLFPRHCVQTKHPFVFRAERSDVCAIVEYWLQMAHTKAGTCRHGDPDNIAKAILDALFVDDRHVLPRCMGLLCGALAAHVDITVTLVGA